MTNKDQQNHMEYSIPIPDRKFPENMPVRLPGKQDPMVDLYEYCGDHPKIRQELPAYYQRGIPGACDKIYMREQAATRLLTAAQLLPEGLQMKLYDAWRPFEVQRFLYQEYYEGVKSANPELTDTQLQKKAAQFVSPPKQDRCRPFVHSTGGALDLTIVESGGQELDMGTAFDDFTDLAHTAYYELEKPLLPGERPEGIKRNRRMLYYIMKQAGFTNLPSEWWHYDYGDGFWSYYCREPAIYEGMEEWQSPKKPGTD